MASLNLSINGPSIRSSYQSIVNSTDNSTPARWALFSVQAPLLNAFQDAGAKESVLKVDGTGSGELDDLIEDFNDGRIQFAFVRVQDPNTRLPKNILVAWCGGGVPERTKGYFTSHLSAVSKILHGYHVQITARSQDDLSPDDIMKKVADASGAKYSAGSAAPAPRGGPPPPVAKKPVYTPTATSTAVNPLVAARNRRQDHVDEDGWGADAPPVTRSQLEKVAPAYKPTKVNLAELTKQKQPEPPSASSHFDRPAESRSDVIGGGYQPIGKVDIAAIRAAAKSKNDDRPTIVKGAYEPVGKVDIAAIRAKATKKDGDDRPTTVKGAYEPVGKVDIAAIRASARPKPDETNDSDNSHAAPARVVPVYAESERLTSLPKPKVAGKFGGASAFAGTKAPTPGLGPATAPKPTVVGSASRTFADQGGMTPSQQWAAKRAQNGGGGGGGGASSLTSPPPQTSPLASPLSSQKSGSEWKSGYKGKSWAPVSTSNFGRAGAVTEQRTSDSSEPHPDDAEEPSSGGGVSALRDRFKGAQPIGQAAPAPSAPGLATRGMHDRAEDDDGPPPPIPSASRPTGGFQLPGLPSRPAEEPEEEPYEREESPVRLAVPVARAPEPEPEPEPTPAPVAARPVPVPAPVHEEPPAPAPAPAAEEEEHAGSGQSALIQYDYEKAEDNEIDLVEGEYVANVEQVDPDWWMGTNSKGETGLFPSNYVELLGDEEPEPVPEPEPVQQPRAAPASAPAPAAPAAAAAPEPEAGAAGGHNAVAEYDYEAGEDNELSFPEGALVTDIEFPDDDWWFGHYQGKSGLFPSNYVKLQ